MNSKIINKFNQLEFLNNDKYVVQGTYTKDECTFLLKNMDGLIEDFSVEEREQLKRNGVPYYALMPKEEPIKESYNKLFLELLNKSTQNIAKCIGIMADSIYAEKGEDTVIVSLVRAGTPFGVLIKDYISYKYGINVPHYSVSIIRKKGIDENALVYILGKHPNAKIQFVDSWTGKGSITNELEKAIKDFNDKYDVSIDNSLAVLADPAKISRICGTREDVIIPNCCLNSTVCGLISRSYCNDDILTDNDFHGAVEYWHLIKDDYSRCFIEKVRKEFVGLETEAEYHDIEHYGQRIIEQIAKEFNVEDEDKIKLSIGEASRMLLRKEPRLLLVKDFKNPDLSHIIEMANDKNIKMISYDKTDYECIAIIN